MTLLQVRDFPPLIYQELGRRAEEERRSIAQQTVVLLQEALGQPEPNQARRRRILAEARDRAATLSPVGLSPEALVREDRDR